jgi:hypothetical protein
MGGTKNLEEALDENYEYNLLAWFTVVGGTAARRKSRPATHKARGPRAGYRRPPLAHPRQAI